MGVHVHKYNLNWSDLETGGLSKRSFVISSIVDKKKILVQLHGEYEKGAKTNVGARPGRSRASSFVVHCRSACRSLPASRVVHPRLTSTLVDSRVFRDVGETCGPFKGLHSVGRRTLRWHCCDKHRQPAGPRSLCVDGPNGRLK